MAANIETLCESCHISKVHGEERRAIEVARHVRNGITITEYRGGDAISATPLPRRTPKELARAAAWGARRLLEATIYAGSGGLHAMALSRGRADWSSIKRRFLIPVEDNEALNDAWRDACARLDLLSVYPHFYTLLPNERVPLESTAQWYALRVDRIDALLAKARRLEEAARVAVEAEFIHEALEEDAPAAPRARRRRRKRTAAR